MKEVIEDYQLWIEIMNMLSDIYQYLQNNLTNFKTIQQIIGMKRLFYRFIVKDWNSDSNTS